MSVLQPVVTRWVTDLPDEQEILTDLLQKRRIEAWREETAAEAKKAAKAYRAGKLKAEPVDAVIAHLRSELERED